MAAVSFEGVSKRYGEVVALDALDLEVREGEFVSLLGPSGSGKSTTLNLLAGLMDADAGVIRIGGRDVTALPPERRDIAMVFQNYALYPHLTVFENMAFPLEARKPKPAASAIRAKVEQVAGVLGIGMLLARYPKEISGGQQQRVALGRAMVRDPTVFLLDEPLSNLDARLRIRMRRDLKALHHAIGSTIVYVTHDQAEAMTLSSRIAVFDHGRLQQYATPAEIYDRPANVFVANFVGDRETNFLDGSLSAEGEELAFASALGRVPLGRPRGALDARGPLRLGVRPEAVGVLPDPDAPLRVTLAELSGADLFLTIRAADGLEVVARADPRATRVAEGDGVRLAFDPSRLHLFDAGTGVAIAHGT
ncbi:ABC transporter ATP-binding protein [Roseomonas sp. AR75]|uniref:ABC transporter ATP-binding protein n=1 Tax=Roseomonas sp. AR75 TaxID=2562311 RepID=UPI0010BF779B|nr:ABC transporter ATP-binding protein [Roseomonas sp. AR75]